MCAAVNTKLVTKYKTVEIKYLFRSSSFWFEVDFFSWRPNPIRTFLHNLGLGVVHQRYGCKTRLLHYLKFKKLTQSTYTLSLKILKNAEKITLCFDMNLHLSFDTHFNFSWIAANIFESNFNFLRFLVLCVGRRGIIVRDRIMYYYLNFTI